MPPYNGQATNIMIYQNDQVFLFNAETVPAGTASQPVQLAWSRGSGSRPGMLSIQTRFAADPGNYQINVEAADLDVDADYVAIQAIGTGFSTTNSSFVSRVDLQAPAAKYLRVRLVSVANNGALTVVITRN